VQLNIILSKLEYTKKKWDQQLSQLCGQEHQVIETINIVDQEDGTHAQRDYGF
jgi:acetolactate synthase small subunit